MPAMTDTPCTIGWINEDGHPAEFLSLTADGLAPSESRLHLCLRDRGHPGLCTCTFCGENHASTLVERWWRWQGAVEQRLWITWYGILANTVCRWRGHDYFGGHLGPVALVECPRCGGFWTAGRHRG